ncbi:hypothetical protein OV203_30400 [Nannocystis sp. ILAH1]|uniref:hypothetical protein n=1 Tax=unclassified Nannocystis TaxID=2627009 RepID=UPI00226DE340|nr:MULTISPECIES: hypothetical protein [unclassified Nannocystis]MCY0991493.1 hypothetical protein [Nannocystis sp. ILAH1]MCY1066542.1 hypothetical protein [Nannocystis sp. RBIL2]
MPAIDVEGVPEAWRAPLVRSLAIFQVGESGEGRIVREIERSRLAGIDADYRAALQLFVKEEGRHARILAAMVRGLGGSLRRNAWTDRLFVQGRRLLGLRLKLLVLLAAEVIGIGFYGLLAERLEDCSIGRALRQICGDEEAHLEFHAAFFRGQTASQWRRALFSVAWFAVAAAACAVVLVDHRPTLRALAIEGAPRRLWGLVRAVHRRVCTGEDVASAGRVSVTA